MVEASSSHTKEDIRFTLHIYVDRKQHNKIPIKANDILKYMRCIHLR